MTDRQEVRDSIAAALTDLGCAAAVRTAALAIVDEAPAVYLWSGTTDAYVALTGGSDSAIGVYVNLKQLSLAMDPQPARLAAQDHGFPVEEKTKATSYVVVPADRLIDPQARRQAVELGVQALARSAGLPAHHSSSQTKAPAKTWTSCPRCHMQLLPDGSCPYCEG